MIGNDYDTTCHSSSQNGGYLLSRYFLREYSREEAERLYEKAVEVIEFAKSFEVILRKIFKDKLDFNLLTA